MVANNDKYYNDLLKAKKVILKHLEDNEQFGLKEAFKDSFGELSSYDNHPADIGSEVFERGKDLALKEEALVHLELIDKALMRINNNTYGKCERCDVVIPDERLEAVPETSLCVVCHQQLDKHDQTRSRPIEEEFMKPGFGKHNYDGSSHETEFDSEDSWQAVAQYGTSNDPSMLGGETSYNDMYTNSHENEKHYHYEHYNQYVDQNEMDFEETFEEEFENNLTESSTVEQQAYQDYLRKLNIE